MTPTASRYVPLLQLRRLRVEQTERAMRRALAAVDDGLAELERARGIEDAWRDAARRLDAWLDDAPTSERVRWNGVADARRTDVGRSLREARDYVSWCGEEVARLREDAARASAVWRRERARLDALVRRRDAERRRAAGRQEESAFQETADAAAAARAVGGGR